jgi:hypothetical protein
MVSPLIRYDYLDDHAHAIGYVCIKWSMLEAECDRLIEVLAPLEHGNASASILGHIDITEKIKIMRALGFLRKTTDAWYDRLDSALKNIDEDVRPKRNRFIHDTWLHKWSPQKTTVIRRQSGAKVTKPQSRQKTLSVFIETIVESSEIWDLAKTIQNVASEVSILRLIHMGLAGPDGRPI